ncbi:MAG: TrmB family transcriptional regulator [Halalkalicoccus sp.]
MTSEGLESVLEEAGFSPYQAAAIVALLDLGSASARTIADASDVPDPRIYDVLRDLEAGGYVETYEDDSLHARIGSLDRLEEELASRAEKLSWASDEVEQRYQRPTSDLGCARVVGGFETAFEGARESIADATDRVQASLTGPQFTKLEEALVAAHERGVDVRLSFHGDREALPATDALAPACTEARYRSLPSPFVVLVDRSRTCFVPHTDSINEYGLIVDDRTHTYVFRWFFALCLWEVWEECYSGRSAEPPTTYADVRECLRAVEPELDAGRTVWIDVEGRWTDTGEACSFAGRLVDCTYTAQSARADAGDTIAAYAGRATLVVDTDEGPVRVGGWGALLEECEATRITVRAIE